MKKRFLSAILILSMLAGVCPVGILATPETEATSEETAATGKVASTAGEETTDGETVPTGGETVAAGELRLIMHRSDDKRFVGAKRTAGAWAATEFTVTLSGIDEEMTFHVGQNEEVSYFSRTGITNGTHTLTITAPNYLTYTQELEFDGRCVQLDLYNYTHINAERTDIDANKSYGVMPVGDMNEDGVIDDEDANEITKHIGAVSVEERKKYDLSGDGKVDLIDLAIVVRNQSNGAVKATPLHTVSSAVLAKTEAKTSGALLSTDSSPLSDLLDQGKKDTNVKLAPALGKTISEESPVQISLTSSEGAEVLADALVIAAPAGSSSTIAAGTVTVEAVEIDTKKEITIEAAIGSDDASSTPRVVSFAAASGLTRIADVPVPMADSPQQAEGVSVESDGTVVINLGKQVAIKVVTIKVTATTADQSNLVEIAKVQFLSDFAERIPEPQLSIPTVSSVTNTESDGLGYKNLTVKWSPQTNVTSYEVKVEGPGYNKTAATTGTRTDDGQLSYTFQGDSFNGTVKSFEKYKIWVRSVNGDWKSDWSDPKEHTVTCTQAPPAPEYVTVTPGIGSLKVTWTCKYDAQTFTLYYKHPDDAGYKAIEKLTDSSYTLTNLQAGVKYTVYVVAHNQNGDSPKSANAEGIPTTASGVQMPKYKLINVDANDGTAATHIKSITANGNSDIVDIVGGEDWMVLVDNNPDSYISIRDWDSGVAYNHNFRGPVITLDDTYTFDTVRFAPFEGETVSIYDAAFGYYDETGELVKVDASLNAKKDAQGRKYYEVIAQRPITTNKFQLRARTFNTAPITMSEVRVYKYDNLEDTVADLFEDEMRIMLKAGVTLEQINDLVYRTNNAIDPDCGEAHPRKDIILADLDYAKSILEHKDPPSHLITVDNQITANGSQSAAFAQNLSDYQPLGCVAAAGDTVVIYVTDHVTARGNSVPLNLIATQYHPQVSAWQSSAVQLKTGRNEIPIPKIGADASERGGSLYLQYTGAKGGRNITVRVTGVNNSVNDIPVLNVDGITGDVRTKAIKAYVEELGAYAGKVESLHNEFHGSDKKNTSVQYSYNEEKCFLNATEICMENMMYSLPATAVWKAINTGNTDTSVKKLENSLAAMEQEIDFFYQFKGLHKDAGTDQDADKAASTDEDYKNTADAYPYTRLNIRYHQMFTGAFMYAGSKHIGIGFDSTSALFNLEPITAEENGKYVRGNLSGWGIAHEIGHCINSPTYQRVEVTNNMFAQLAKTGDATNAETNANFRTTYDKVYQAVATGATGHTGDLAVQLAMYWQLHLAYDDNYAYKLYGSAGAAQEAMFYARLESYLRDGKKAPYPFTASSGDQLFMQAACAAAGKDILDFFRAWGFTPDATTVDYVAKAKFNEETRKIQYIDDDSRIYRLEKKPGMSTGTKVTASITNTDKPRINGNMVEITLSNNNTNPDAMLGYEISRNGKVVAFIPAADGETTYYTDVVTENNKALTYTVIGIDRLLKETEPVTLDEVKVSHDGAISKAAWTAQTNMEPSKDDLVEKDEDDPESGVVSGGTLPAPEKVSTIKDAIDNDPRTVYHGTSSSEPTVTLNLGGVEQVTAIKFTPAKQGSSSDSGDDLYSCRLLGYTVEISLDNTNWTIVKTGSTEDNDVKPNTDGSYTLYFNKQLDDKSMDPYMYTYDAAYVRITATDTNQLAVAEIDVLGPTGDNVDFIENGFGKLEKDYHAGEFADGEPCIIPAGSIVFYGEYKGDPSYSVVLLKDQDGKTLSGSQIILAEVAESGALGETSDGQWLFWLEDETQLAGHTTVQAELYRVNDPFALAGQRLTSTSLTFTIPDVIPDANIVSSASLAAYVPGPEAVLAAAAGEQNIMVTEVYDPYLGAIALADTGAAEGNDPTPIQLTSDGAYVTAKFRPADATSIAVQADLTLSAAIPADVTVHPAARDNTFQSYKYDPATGELTLFAVARQAGLGEGKLSAQLTPSANCTITVAGLSLLSSIFESSNVGDLPNNSTKFSKDTPHGGDNDNPSGTSKPSSSDKTSSDTTTKTETLDDGTTVKTVTEKDGTVTKITTTKNGTYSTVKTDKNGKIVSMEASASRTDANESKTAGKTVKLPLLVEPAKNTNSAVDIAVTVQGGGSAKVEIPTTSVTPGTVAVIVKEDGTEEIVKTSIVTEIGVALNVEGNATVKIVNNSKDFTDIAGHWGRNAIDFSTARELFYGTSENTFSPNSKLARAMLMVILARFNNEDTIVTDGNWYDKGMKWAMENGVSDGTNPNGDITREQLVAMLYRYAGGKKTSGSLAAFPDAGQVSGWAQDAMVWAVGVGIIRGTDTGLLNPLGSATRAELAVIMQQFCEMLMK